LAVGLMALGQPALAQMQEELRRFLHDDASATLHIRSYFFDRVNATPPSLVTLAGGGWVGLQTGWFYDTVQLGAVGYGFFALGQAASTSSPAKLGRCPRTEGS
jgi:hypothetical protein